MDAVFIGIGLAFFAVAWALVWAFSHLQGGKQP
jgi:hypothetical protein